MSGEGQERNFAKGKTEEARVDPPPLQKKKKCSRQRNDIPKIVFKQYNTTMT